MRPILRVILVALVANVPLCAASEVTLATAEELRQQALKGSPAWSILTSLVTDVGPRQAGSPGMARARDWALVTMRRLGLQNVHAEVFTKREGWERGPEEAVITMPVPRHLAILGLGGSVPTPPGGLEAEVVEVSTLEDLRLAPRERIVGRIVFLNRPMPVSRDGTGYRLVRQGRTEGPSLAAERGAVAFLMRSLATGGARFAHTGMLRYTADGARIPAAALAIPDADLLQRLLVSGNPVRVRLVLHASLLDAVASWNIVGEVPGLQGARDIVLIGAHLDSWDVSEAAADDGAGVAICLAAAQLIGALPRSAPRTLRVVLWGAEETDESGPAYAIAHAGERSHVVLAAESDTGAGRVYEFALSPGRQILGHPGELASMLGQVLAPLGIRPSLSFNEIGMTDLEPLYESGVPVLRLAQDATRYFEVHHSADDTLARVDAADLDQNVAAWATALYAVLNAPAAPF